MELGHGEKGMTRIKRCCLMTITKLVNVSNQYGVDVKKMKIENYIDLNKDIRHIVKKYNAV